MSSLYGELGGGHSFGLSLQHVEYISNNHFVYASGNHLNVVDTKTLSDANNQTTEPHPKTKTPFPDVNSVIDHKSAENPNSEGAIENDQTTDGNNEARHSFSQPAISTRLKPFVLESDVTAFACYRRGSVIAVAESGSTNIKILKWPSGAQLGVLQAYPDISINSLSFSFDGQYLAVLGSLPTFQVSVWDWRSATMICSSSNELPANQVSFNPGNSNQLCTSGLDGGVKFWQINIGFKKNNLTFTQGSLCPSIETYANEKMNMVSLFHGNKGFITEQFDAFKITPKIHAWRVDQQVLCTTSDGDLIVQYNPVSAECNVVLSAKRHFGQKTETNLNKNSGKPQKTATDTVISTLLGNDGTDEEKNNEFEIREFKDGFAECGNNMNHIIVGKDYIAVGGKDGNVRIIKADGEMVPYVASVVSVSNFPVSALCVSPDYQEILVVTEKRNIFCYKIFSGEVFLAVNNDTGYIIAADISKLTGLLATAHSNGVLRFWDTETTSTLGVITIPATLSFLSMSPFSTVVAVGSQHGVLRIYDTSTILTTTPKLIFREKIHDGVITQGSFNYSGSLLATISNDGRVCLTDLKTTFRTIRFIRLSHGLPVSVLWSSEDPGEDLSMSLRLFVLTVNDKQKNSCVHRFQYPEDDQLDNFSGEIPNSKMPVVMYQFEEELSDFVVLPKHFSSGRKSFYVCGKDRKLKLYVAPQQKTQSKPQLEETILMEAASSEYLDHEKSSVHVRLSHLRDWAITWAPDGVITLRTLLDPEKMLKIPAHDSRFGGVKDVCLTIDARTIVSIGGDSILKIWEWNYSAAGRRAATDANGNGEQIIAGQEAMIAEFAEKINLTLRVEDVQDSSGEPNVFSESLSSTQAEVGEVNEKNLFRQKMLAKVQMIRERLQKTVQKNETLPEIEKVDREEFIVDFEERDRLLAKADAQIKSIRKVIEEENLKKRVLRNRIKKECWDSMEVCGQSIKSFHPDPLTGKLIDVTNFPQRKRSEIEISLINKIKVARKVQIMVAHMTKQLQKKSTVNSNVLDEEGEINSTADIPSDFEKLTNKELLYDAFELTTNERKQIQIYLLNEVIQDIKTAFNEKFKEIEKLKSDEISKIEDKNDRILTITKELSIQEPIFKPTLDDDEVPQRCITVNDGEVTVEKFITAEEKRRMEEKQRLEQERLLAAQEDNFRERALMAMMGGKLEDRSEQEEKEELVRPEWMSKPKEDLNDEEKRLIKEFEKKLAVFKEEQEKYRKALETELKKLQSSITEICDNFDRQLQQLAYLKLTTDQQIFQNELRIIKLRQSVILIENNETKEVELNEKIDTLKSRKSQCSTEIPELKKALEKNREEYEAAVKRDKEVEKLFRKEFYAYDFFFESLLKLFKRREKPNVENDAQKPTTQESLNPFLPFERTLTTSDEPAVELDIQTDLPEGLSIELWDKLVEIRSRKIESESDVRNTLRKLTQIQSLLQSITEESERLKSEIEYASTELKDFLDYKFQRIYNMESLFELKQGQVEVLQAPVITDYNDAALIHRSVVERLNESIVSLGQQKVEALKEMKEYRKGIHALEWENKLLDFQSEDLLSKTRDIQLLRLTKQMQEYLRSGDEHKQSSEVTALEKRADYSQKTHSHKIEEKQRLISKLENKIFGKIDENKKLQLQLRDIEQSVQDRHQIHNSQGKMQTGLTQKQSNMQEIYARRRLVDMAKSQAQDIAILREELERLRLRTYPAFPANRGELY